MIYQILEEHLLNTETPISPFHTCGFSNPVTSEVKLFTTIVHNWKPLTIAAKNSILKVACVVDIKLSFYELILL